MKRGFWTSALALCLGTVAVAWSGDRPDGGEPPEAPKVIELGSKVDASLTLTDLDGKTLGFEELRGKVVFIHFWSKDCPYEKVADPKVQALEKRWKGKDVVVVAIDSNVTEIGPEAPEDPAEGYQAIRKHLREKGLDHRVFADHGNVVADLFGAQHTPHCFVLDKQGVLVYRGGLDDDPKGDKGDKAKQYVRDAVEATLAGKPIEHAETKPYGCGIKRVRSQG